MQGKYINGYKLVCRLDDYDHLDIALEINGEISEPIFGIGKNLDMVAELKTTSLGDLRRHHMASQFMELIKDFIPYGMKVQQLVVNEDTVDIMMKGHYGTYEELTKLFLTTPIGKLLALVGFNEFEFETFSGGECLDSFPARLETIRKDLENFHGFNVQCTKAYPKYLKAL